MIPLPHKVVVAVDQDMIGGVEGSLYWSQSCISSPLSLKMIENADCVALYMVFICPILCRFKLFSAEG